MRKPSPATAYLIFVSGEKESIHREAQSNVVDKIEVMMKHTLDDSICDLFVVEYYCLMFIFIFV